MQQDDLRQVVDRVLQRNGFFAHVENLLLCMLTDERPHIRLLAYKRILASRKQTPEGENVPRKFAVPVLNFNANDYIDLIDWNEPKRKRYEPPLTEMITGTEIETIAKTGKAPDTQLFKVLCHSQGTKRCVRLVTEASGKVCGLEERHGFILARIKSQQAMKKIQRQISI
ncbi:hypothetical protein AVEN_253454-1 [Araneus ventricosus]|uniref:Uncharacterized protein n=1 Tax=Araneus ventricosus TaxID=182803 RepID=A0A4Y2MRY5_ARAVE|nr:hypothetical protein AVEN_253454-1 [Araneus ventricosus]